jgi:hypothetical protein
MKRFLLLGACIVLCSSLVARADVYEVRDQADNQLLGTLDVNRTVAVPGSIDKLVLTCTSIQGKAAGKGIYTIEGRGVFGSADYGWYAVKPDGTLDPKGLIVTTGQVYDWAGETVKRAYSDTNPTSWVNLPGALAGDLDWGTGIYSLNGTVQFARNGVGGVNGWDAGSLSWLGTGSDYLRGSWFSLSPISPTNPIPPPGNRDLATMYVKTGDGVQFRGRVSYGEPGGPSINPFVYLVPEPSTLVLLGIGGLGLMAYVWRRRRA